MEKFTPLAKILHCHRQWREWQLWPLYKQLIHLSNKGPPLMLDLNSSLFGFAVARKLSKSLVLWQPMFVILQNIWLFCSSRRIQLLGTKVKKGELTKTVVTQHPQQKTTSKRWLLPKERRAEEEGLRNKRRPSHTTYDFAGVPKKSKSISDWLLDSRC